MKKIFLSFFIMLFTCYTGNGQEIDYAVRIKLKPLTDESYKATNDVDMKNLMSKHDVIMTQTYPGKRSTPELLLYYSLRGKGSMSKESRENFIKDFLATGKFEDEVYEYGIAYGNL